MHRKQSCKVCGSGIERVVGRIIRNQVQPLGVVKSGRNPLDFALISNTTLGNRVYNTQFLLSKQAIN